MSAAVVSAVLRAALDAGVREFVVCAGARNSGLVVALASAPAPVRIWRHFEERSAAFFALGRILAGAGPVAVVTTSGTAVAELLPAAVEAHYQGLPLLLLTADRPENYRGTGAPQAIEQAEIFGVYAAPAIDAPREEPGGLAAWTMGGPAHLNVCIEEPAAGELPALRALGAALVVPQSSVDQVDAWQSKRAGRPCSLRWRAEADPTFSEEHRASTGHQQGSTGVPPVSNATCRIPPTAEGDKMIPIPDPPGPPLLLFGDLLPHERPAAEALALRLNAPVYAEAASGLRENPALRHLLLTGGDTALRHVPHGFVIRVGGVPSCRFWRDLEARPDIAVISFSRTGHRGLARECAVFPLNAESLERLIVPSGSEDEMEGRVTAPGETPGGTAGTAVLPFSMPATVWAGSALDAALAAWPASEPAVFRALSRFIPADGVVFTGNSMPIREWNLCAAPAHPLPAHALRGANGIDGNLSAFLGLAADADEAWAIVGDLTALYDLAAPYVLSQIPRPRLRIVVIQNGGGRIFSRLPQLAGLTENERALMENPHTISLEGWARMWGLEWRAVHAPLTTQDDLPDRVVLEIFPDAEQTEGFWKQWRQATPPAAP